MTLFQNEESPVLSRSFFKTEWSKPKFINKPYIETRREESLVDSNISNIKPALPSKKPNTPTKLLPKVKKSIHIKSIRNNMPGQITNLNLEQLLLPTMASVFYEIERYHHTDSANYSKNNFTSSDSKLLTANDEQSIVDDCKAHETLLSKARCFLLTMDEGPTSNRKKEKEKKAEKTSSKIKKQELETKVPDQKISKREEDITDKDLKCQSNNILDIETAITY